MKNVSREWIECFAFVGIQSAATSHVAGEIASKVKSPIAKVVVIGATMAANAYIGYRMGDFVEGYSLSKKPTCVIHIDDFDF